MNPNVLHDIFTLRMCIGYMGESDQHAWWPSAFLTPTSSAFLAPVFGKTRLHAQYYGLRDAAALVHDEHIGIGKGVFHLFRLPEAYEIDMHRLLSSQDTMAAVENMITCKAAAEQFLSEYGQDSDEQAIGPFRLDDTIRISAPQTWAAIAGRYAGAFKNDNPIFPYFTAPS